MKHLGVLFFITLVLLGGCGSQSTLTPLNASNPSVNANPQGTPPPSFNNALGCQMNFSLDTLFENHPPAAFPINQEFLFQASESSLTFVNSNCPTSLPSATGFDLWAGRLMVGVPDTFGLLFFDTLVLGTPVTVNPTNLNFSVVSQEIHLAHEGCHLTVEISNGEMVDDAHHSFDHPTYGVHGTVALKFVHFHEADQTYGDVAECFE